jgi:50S ribosomal protein L16 3-hydroxylase
VLGEWLTEPKPQVWFQPGATLEAGHGVRLDLRTRMMYDDWHVFLNGESFRASGPDARWMRQLADQRTLGPREVAALSVQARALLEDAVQAGWMHAHPPLRGAL